MPRQGKACQGQAMPRPEPCQGHAMPRHDMPRPRHDMPTQGKATPCQQQAKATHAKAMPNARQGNPKATQAKATHAKAMPNQGKPRHAQRKASQGMPNARQAKANASQGNACQGHAQRKERQAKGNASQGNACQGQAKAMPLIGAMPLPRPRHAKARHANATQSKAMPTQGMPRRTDMARQGKAKAQGQSQGKPKPTQGQEQAQRKARQARKNTKCRMGSLAKFRGKVEVGKGGGGTNRSDAGLNLSGSGQQGHSATCNTPADIEGSKSSVAMNAWLPQASYPCGNFSDTSGFKFRRSKGSIGHAFTVRIRTGNQNQTSFYPFVPHEISVLVELILGHLRYLLTDVPPQPNSPPDNVFPPGSADARPALGPKRGAMPRLRFTE
ncbi:unnamed protein product [Prunus brigantina]